MCKQYFKLLLTVFQRLPSPFYIQAAIGFSSFHHSMKNSFKRPGNTLQIVHFFIIISFFFVTLPYLYSCYQGLFWKLIFGAFKDTMTSDIWVSPKNFKCPSFLIYTPEENMVSALSGIKWQCKATAHSEVNTISRKLFICETLSTNPIKG